MKACTQCGKCCQQYVDGGLSATDSEIDWWETFRPAIYAYVKNGEIWFDPVSGERLTQCPWLEELPGNKGFSCSIYHDRPDDCKYYPTNIAEMVRDECEMIEVRDLKNPISAQKSLDKLMIDSRPPLASLP